MGALPAVARARLMFVDGIFRGLFVVSPERLADKFELRRARAPRCPKCSHWPAPRMAMIFILDAYQCRWGHVTTGLELYDARSAA